MKSSFTTAMLFASASLENIFTDAKIAKFGVITDIHLQPNYYPDRDSGNGHYCELDDPIAEEMAYFGRLGCDSPFNLVDTIMQKMSHDNPDLDAIFVPGDLIGHGIPVDTWEVDTLTTKEIE